MKYLTRKTAQGERLQFIFRSSQEGGADASEAHMLDFAYAVDLLREIQARESGKLDHALQELTPPSGFAPCTLLELLLAGEAWWTYGLHVEALCRQLFTSAQRAACELPGTPLPVISRPPSVRDFYAFEAHVTRARARRGLAMVPEWYAFPVFYFSNPCALLADGEAVKGPAATNKLDFELEAAVVVRRVMRDVAPDDVIAGLAGITIMNDWSARDLQASEVKVGLGPAKGKDFATSLGPVLVTFDELESRLVDAGAGRGAHVDLSMRAFVNGRLLTEGNLRDLHFTLGELIARAAADVTLYPGEVIGTGTVGGGCILELGEEVVPWLQPADEVTLVIDRIGSLTNVVV